MPAIGNKDKAMFLCLDPREAAAVKIAMKIAFEAIREDAPLFTIENEECPTEALQVLVDVADFMDVHFPEAEKVTWEKRRPSSEEMLQKILQSTSLFDREEDERDADEWAGSEGGSGGPKDYAETSPLFTESEEELLRDVPEEDDEDGWRRLEAIAEQMEKKRSCDTRTPAKPAYECEEKRYPAMRRRNL